MAVRTAYVPVAGAVLTAANLAKVAGGWIGYAEQTVSQTGIGGAATDLTSLTVTVTVGTGRRIRITGQVDVQQLTNASRGDALIMEGATQLCSVSQDMTIGGFRLFTWSRVLDSPTPGSHTYKLQFLTTAGTSSTNVSATSPAFILVEDLGSTP